MKKNKGYTLVEMLIVIAIMAVVTGMAFVTIGIIYQARCNAAIDTFNSQIDTLWIQTKALSQGKTQAESTELKLQYPMCMKIQKNTDSSDDVRDGAYELIIGYDSGSTVEIPTSKMVLSTLTHFVDIRYTPATGVDKHDETTDSVTSADNTIGYNETIIVEFNKSDGSVRYGAGTYDFIYNDKVVGTIYLDSETGNHYIK